jgi:uncharacterized membrane protein
MRIHDPLRMNDWDIIPFLLAVLIVQAAVLLVLGTNGGDSGLLLLRQLICFVYLVFVPGVLILRALRLHGLGPVETPLYSIGLSLTTLMLAGLGLNTLLPLIGYDRPISLFPLTAALTAVVLVLCVICYLRDRHYKGDATVELDAGLASRALLLLLLPFMAIFGTYVMNHYGNNTLLLVMILAIAVIVLLAGFDRLIPRQLYPLAILAIAIALLFHNSLISDSLIGWDIHQEKFVADAVINGGSWNSSVDYILNSMLSIMMLAPIFSIFLDANVIWVYKIVFPLLFAFVPVALYQAYRKQSDEKVGFMAAFFFVSLVVFFSEMLAIARQEIAELFLALLVMLIVDRSMEKTRWSLLFLIFAASLVLSHYGLTFIFIGILAVSWALMYVVSRLKRETVRDMNRRLTPLLIAGFLVFCAIWYIYTSSANPLATVVLVSKNIESPIEDMARDYLAPGVTPAPTALPPTPGTTTPLTPTPTPAPQTTQPLILIESGGSASLLHRLFVYLLLSTQGILVIGVLAAGFRKWSMKVKREFYVMAFVNLVVLIVALVLPNFASALNTTRLYQIALIFLAPFLVLGWIAIFRFLGSLVRRDRPGTVALAIELLSIFLVIYLIFNTGMIFQIARDVPMSYSLDSLGANLTYTIYNNLEVSGAEWMIHAQRDIELAQNHTYTPPIFSDTYRWLLLQDWNTSRSYQLPTAIDDTPPGSYIYMGTYNVAKDKAVQVLWMGDNEKLSLLDLKGIRKTRDKIFANGGSEIFL